MNSKLLCSLLTVVCAVACGSDDDSGPTQQAQCEKGPLPEVDCDAVTVPGFADVEAFQVSTDICTQCHYTMLSGLARNGAPSAINLDLYESASEYAEAAARAVYHGCMPPEGVDIGDERKEQIYNWALCGTPD